MMTVDGCRESYVHLPIHPPPYLSDFNPHKGMEGREDVEVAGEKRASQSSQYYFGLRMKFKCQRDYRISKVLTYVRMRKCPFKKAQML